MMRLNTEHDLKKCDTCQVSHYIYIFRDISQCKKREHLQHKI
jgi:hypothetical protein